MVDNPNKRLPPYSFFPTYFMLFKFGSPSQNLDSIVFEGVQVGDKFLEIVKIMVKYDIFCNFSSSRQITSDMIDISIL